MKFGKVYGMNRKKIYPLSLTFRVLVMLSIVIMLCCVVPVSAVSDTVTVYTTNVSDGRVERSVHNATFSDLRNGQGTIGYSTGNDSIARIISDQLSNEYYSIVRGVLIFNTSILPDDATITSAKIGIYVIERNLSAGNTNISITKFTTAGTINTGDYQNFNDIRLTDDKSITTMTSFRYHNFTLNADSLSNISLTGDSGFGVRTAFDIDNTSPTWVSRSDTMIRFNTADNGTFIPFIEISYTNTTCSSPVSSFTTNVTSGTAPLDVQFNDTSTNTPTSWNWSFGDDTWFNTTVAAERNATHLYTIPDSYTAKLTVSNACGSNTTEPGILIEVTQAEPVASFTATPTEGIAPLLVQFNDTSTNTPTSWNWSFGDDTWFNTTVAAERNATYTYNAPGTFTARLTVANSGGSNTTEPGTLIEVTQAEPVASFTATPTEGIAPLLVQFNDTSTNAPASWNWSFGDDTWFNTTVAAERNATYTYNAPGTFTARLTVANAGGSNTTEPGTLITVTPAPVAPIADFTGSPQLGAVPLTVTFTDNSTGTTPLTYAWDFGDGSGDTAQSPVHTYANVGTYNVSLTVDNIAGSNMTTRFNYINVTHVTDKIGVFRPSTHIYYQDFNGNGVWNGAVIDRAYNFGITGDLPVSGDWNNDRISEIGVFRPSTHIYYQDFNGNGVWEGAEMDRAYNFGITGDLPVSGDWNNDRISEIGVFRPSTHIYYQDFNGDSVWNGAVIDRAYNFGITEDLPVSGDWTNDGISEIGVFRNSTHLFYLDYNGNGVWNGAKVDRSYNFGITGDIPITGDWNNDGIS